MLGTKHGKYLVFPTNTDQLNQNEDCLHYSKRKTHPMSLHLRLVPVSNTAGQGRDKGNR